MNFSSLSGDFFRRTAKTITGLKNKDNSPLKEVLPPCNPVADML